MPTRPVRDKVNVDKTGVRMLGGHAREVISDLVIPQSIHRRVNSLKQGLPHGVIYFQRLRAGRRCSCWGLIASSPNMDCPICYGVGFVGGYHRVGCTDLWFDSTVPNIQLVNVLPRQNTELPYVPLVLSDTAVEGVIEFTLPTPRLNTQALAQYQWAKPELWDVWEMKYRAVAGSSVTWEILDADGNVHPTWDDYLGAAPPRNRLVRLRVTLRRDNPDIEPPLFGYGRLRYQTGNSPFGWAAINLPQLEGELQLKELGRLFVIQSQEMKVDNTIAEVVNNEDWFYDTWNEYRWMVVRQTLQVIQRRVIGGSVTVRLLHQEHDSAVKYPVGYTGEPFGFFPQEVRRQKGTP
jgi:hypothetical protein